MKLLSVIFLLTISMTSQAETVARVVEVNGNAFSFMGKKASSLKYGSKLEDLSEVMVEDGATLSLVNNDGHLFHINGGSLVKLYNGILELKNGHVWVQSKSDEKGLFNTSNSIGQYGKGQFIYSFDNISGKTQLLVLKGTVKFSNALEPTLFTKISSGHFSLIEQNYENGLPRAPTKVGLKSYKQMKNTFANFESLQNNEIEKMLWGQPVEKKSRSIASVSTSSNTKQAPIKAGRIITIRTIRGGGSRVPASAGPMEYYQNLKKKEAWKFKPMKSKNVAPVRYFGESWKNKKAAIAHQMVKTQINPKQNTKVHSVKITDKTPQTKTSRVPASVGKSQLIQDLKRSDFEKSLTIGADKDKRHSNEVNNLIDELKSYKKDFKKDY
ncbi:MAG: hypothetical protein ACJAS4_000810 [Bacteriovoracaceae bacterium]|jgi:hypothetical protein